MNLYLTESGVDTLHSINAHRQARAARKQIVQQKRERRQRIIGVLKFAGELAFGTFLVYLLMLCACLG